MIQWRRIGDEWHGDGFKIVIINESASGKPNLWELRDPASPKPRAYQSVSEAKTRAEIELAVRRERTRVRFVLRKLQADCHCGNFSAETIFAALYGIGEEKR